MTTPPLRSAAAARIVRGALAIVSVIVSVGGIPGAPNDRNLLVDEARDSTPPLPGDIEDRDGVIDVAVRGAPDGNAVAGATVRALTVVDGRAYLAQATETDARGRAQLSKIPRGDAWILADAPRRARGSMRLTVDVVARSLAFELGPEHSLEIAASDDRGAPIEGAAIEVLAPGESLPVGGKTGADGRVRIGRLGPGPWRATARLPGYEEVTGRSAAEPAAIPLILRKLGGITAHVVGLRGEPAAGARVSIAGVALWPARMAMADADGNVRVGGLAAGTYALRATKGDAVSAIELEVTIGRGDEKGTDLQLVRGRFVSVRVTDGNAVDAEPIRSARAVLAEGGISPFPLETTTDAAGRARLGPIAPGTATLTARADGFVGGAPLSVPDSPAGEIRVALLRAGAVGGRVVDARGRPIDGAALEIVGTDPVGQPIDDEPRRAGFQTAHFEAMLAGPSPLLPGGELGVVAGPVPAIPIGHFVRGASLGSALAASSPGAALSTASIADSWVTRADGTFRIAPASPGRVRVVVRHPQYVEAESDLVTLAPGGEAHVDVMMHEGGALEGRVIDAQGRPVEGANVVVAATRGFLERSTRTARDGSFAFVALPESVMVTASVSDPDIPDARTTVAVPEGGRAEETIALQEPREALPVSVVDATGWPIDAAEVSATSLSPDAVLRTTTFTDAHGDAAIRRARGLPIRVEVRAPSHAPRVLTADGTEDTLRIALEPSERAVGEVVAEVGRDAVAGAEITLYTDLGATRARTDAAGRFALTGLSSGDARMRVRATGYAPWSKSLTIPSSGGGAPFALPRVDLVAEGAALGEVVDARGDPVVGARVAKDEVPTWVLAGATPAAVATTDSKGRFALHELPEGLVTLEAYAPSVGRSRSGPVKVVAGRITDRVRIVMAGDESSASEPAATGGVAITLGETGAPSEVVVVSVVEESAAERAGILPGDVVLAVDGADVGTMEVAREKLSGPIAGDAVVSLRRGDRALTIRVPREAIRR